MQHKIRVGLSAMNIIEFTTFQIYLLLKGFKKAFKRLNKIFKLSVDNFSEESKVFINIRQISGCLTGHRFIEQKVENVLIQKQNWCQSEISKLIEKREITKSIHFNFRRFLNLPNVVSLPSFADVRFFIILHRIK